MSKKLLIKDLWDKFDEIAYPDGMVFEQRKQIERAFMAGALSVVEATIACVGRHDGAEILSALFRDIRDHINKLVEEDGPYDDDDD